MKEKIIKWLLLPFTLLSCIIAYYSMDGKSVGTLKEFLHFVFFEDNTEG
jgi:hypothetical protein